jgi:hypothetical protein
VNGVLVQVPLVTGVGPSRTCTEPDVAGDVAGAEVDGALPGAEVVVGDEVPVVVDDVDVVLDVLCEEDPLGTGKV